MSDKKIVFMEDENCCSVGCDYYSENRCELFDKPIICRWQDHELVRLEICKVQIREKEATHERINR